MVFTVKLEDVGRKIGSVGRKIHITIGPI